VGSRNGDEPGRVRTAEGAIAVAVPQVRGVGEPFRSSLMSFLDGNSEVLERLVTEMYARGLSTRDVEDAFRDATGELLISKSAVSGITDRLWEDYQAFISRDLSEISVEYLFVDAIFVLEREGFDPTQIRRVVGEFLDEVPGFAGGRVGESDYRFTHGALDQLRARLSL
jgi:transposase-like protein